MQELFQYLLVPVTMLGIYAIQAMSLQLILGGAGLLSLGHAAFFAVGGYASALVTVIVAPRLGVTSEPLMLALGLVAGMLAAGLAGLVVAVPCLRLQGDYLAMATLGFGEIISTLFKNIDIVGGTRGFTDIPRLTSPGLIWVFVLVTGLFVARLYKSGLGMAILATRDDEIAARSVGISTQKAKTAAFVIGSALAGMAGVFYAHFLQLMSPDEAGFLKSVEIVLAVVIGGMYSLWGSVFGAIVLVAVPELFRHAPEVIASNRMLFFALVVIILMLVNPKGIADLFSRFQKSKAARVTHAR